MVSDDRKGVLSSLQPVPPFIQCQINGKQLRWGKLLGEVSTRVESRRLSVALRWHSSHTGCLDIHFHYEWELGLWMGEDGSSAEGLLELLVGGLSFGVPGKRVGFLT